jgi:hypothetical protein
MKNSAMVFLTALVFGLLALVSASGQTNPLTADPFAGVFSDGALTVRLERDGAAYEGVIEFSGQRFPAAARRQGEQLIGSFRSEGASFDFVAVREGAILRFETGGTAYHLSPQGMSTRPTNPLARSETPAVPPSASGRSVAERPRYVNAAGGYSIALPAGWQPRDDDSGDLALVPPGGSLNVGGENSEVYLVISIPDTASPSQPDVKAQLQQAFIHPQSLAAATYSSRTSGEVVIHEWQFAHPETGQVLRLHAYLTGVQGRVFAVMGIALPSVLRTRDQALLQMATSLRAASGQVMPQQGGQPAAATQPPGVQTHPMAPPTPGRLSDNNPQSLQWLNHLRGKLLSRLSSYSSGTAGGYSSNERMLLYPNGQFEYYSASNVSVQSDGPVYSAGASSGGQGTRRGTWRIVTVQGTSFLALVYEGSRQEEYAELDYRNNQTFIDGSRVFVTNPQ